jgi:hypothetical protein
MRRALQEVWDAGGAEASYVFASAEKKKTECIIAFDFENYFAIHTRCTFSFRNMMASATVSDLRGLASRISMSFVSSDAERSE